MIEYVRISTPSRSATCAASPTGRTLKPSTIASEAAASMMSDSVMPPTPDRTTCTWTSDCGSFAISSSNAASVLEDRRERPGPLRAARLRLALEAEAALLRELAGAAVVLDDAHVLAGLRDAVEAEHLDRLGRRGVLDLVA